MKLCWRSGEKSANGEKLNPRYCYFPGLKVHGGCHGLMNVTSAKWWTWAFKVHGGRHGLMANPVSVKCILLTFSCLFGGAHGCHVIASTMVNAMSAEPWYFLYFLLFCPVFSHGYSYLKIPEINTIYQYNIIKIRQNKVKYHVNRVRNVICFVVITILNKME